MAWAFLSVCRRRDWRLFTFGFMLGNAFIAMTGVFAATSDQGLEEVRQQANIKSSYNFTSLPPNAGKGITVAIISQGIS